MTTQFNGHKKTGESLLSPIEKNYVVKLMPFISPYFETYHLTWLTIVWSIGVYIFSFAAKSDIRWLFAVSIMIVMQYVTDHFDGAIGRRKRTGLVKWGYYMDHFLDYVFLCSLIVGYSFLADNSHQYLFLYLLAICGGFMVNTFVDFSATNAFRLSYYKIGPTEMRILFIVSNLILIVFGVRILNMLLPYVIGISFLSLCVIVYVTQRNLWQIDMIEQKKTIIPKAYFWFVKIYFLRIFRKRKKPHYY